MKFPVVVLLSLALVVSAAAQRSSGSGRGSAASSNPSPGSFPSRGIQSISIRITTEDGRPVDGSIRVEVLSSTGVTVSDVFARDGMAQVGNIPPGSYRLRVSSPDIEQTTTDAFYVMQNEQSLQFVRVKVRTPGEAGSTQGTVSAHELNIPDKAKSERRKGDEQIAKSDWKKALEHLNKAIAIYPQYASAYTDLGYVYIRLGDKAHAREAFQKAAELDEHTGVALLNLARMAMDEKDLPEAIRLANKSLALAPNNPEALLVLANCELMAGQYAAAVTHARKVHGLAHERYAIAHLIAAVGLEAQQKPSDAALEYETFLKEDPNNARAATAREALARLTAQAASATPKP